MRYQIQSLALLVQQNGGIRWTRKEGWTLGPAPPPPPPPPPPPSSTITPSLRVSHVPDGSARQSTMVASDGSTVINGTVPLMLFFDAADSRCSSTATTDVEAWWNLRYQMNYGYGAGQNWSISGKPYSHDIGEPLFGRVIEAAGSYPMSLEIRNPSGGVRTLNFTVIATDPAPPTIIEVSAGAWPAWVSGTHYALRADGNYLSFGDIQMGGQRDIVISKVGTGADPLVSGFNPDNRDIRNVSEIVAPSRNIRLVDVDVDRYHSGAMGPQFCGAVRGRVRRYTGDAFDYWYEHEGTTTVRRSNIRYPRGVFLWKTGKLVCPPLDYYVLITTLREFVMQGVTVEKDGPTGNHAIRNKGRDHVHRHSAIYAIVASASLVKTQAGNGITPWTDSDDCAGTVEGTREWDHRPTSRLIFADMVFHTPTSVIPDICFGAGAENNEVGFGHGSSELIALSRSVSMENTWQAFAGLDVQMNGRGHSTRDVRLANGTYVTQSAGAWVNNVPPGFNGPYLYETVDSRDSY